MVMIVTIVVIVKSEILPCVSNEDYCSLFCPSSVYLCTLVYKATKQYTNFTEKNPS